MAQNIFTYENLQPYRRTNSNVDGNAILIQRNGEWSISIAPAYFYSGGVYTDILGNEFAPNTQYVIDIWEDVDDVIYNNKNVQGGLWLEYTDLTTQYSWSDTGPKGWIHKHAITTAGKSIKGIHSYYYTSVPVYYRWDSYIIPYTENLNITRTGQTNTGHIVENYPKASIYNGGGLCVPSVYEN